MASVTLNGDKKALEVSVKRSEIAFATINGIRNAVKTLHWETETEVTDAGTRLFIMLGKKTAGQVDAMARNIAEALTAEGLHVE